MLTHNGCDTRIGLCKFKPKQNPSMVRRSGHEVPVPAEEPLANDSFWSGQSALFNVGAFAGQPALQQKSMVYEQHKVDLIVLRVVL